MASVSTTSAVYKLAEDYWEHQEPSLNGMLGGLLEIGEADVACSRDFILSVSKQTGSSFNYALDCGAGIGRVTRDLLLPLFRMIDMVELVQQFLDQSVEFLGSERNARIGHRFCSGLQNFAAPCGRYDAIWCQWVLSHLSDDDLVAFLTKCREGLRESGIVFVKENVCTKRERDFDDVDNSWTRSRATFIQIFRKAGLRILNERRQTGFPKHLYQVRIFALRPTQRLTVDDGLATTQSIDAVPNVSVVSNSEYSPCHAVSDSTEIVLSIRDHIDSVSSDLSAVQNCA